MILCPSDFFCTEKSVEIRWFGCRNERNRLRSSLGLLCGGGKRCLDRQEQVDRNGSAYNCRKPSCNGTSLWTMVKKSCMK
ncbi:hypothetical protein CEXT_121071 [Caerostris extrusa]|uniref:Uncharacterized protein n=1 Tax=Caerostris extrusa TaxID=172846 RepID=A0AAV4SZC5_CAEEX|nr:hypothetical protein CEXT_121071 [Caerostris extrusa]